MANEKIRIINTEVTEVEPHRLKKVTYEMLQEDGTWQQNSKQMYDTGKAATILLYNKNQRTVILTQQFRLPTYINGHSTGILLEACAGMMEDNTPEECAIREAEEETGYKIKEVEKVYELYMSPGFVTELLYFFIAEYNASMKVSEGGGLEEEQENIVVKEIDIDKAMNMIRSGSIQDAKTIILLQYAKLNLFQ